MLVRIQEISQVGRFASFKAPAIQFAPFTLVFGENTCGKSTLADILHSLETQDATPLLARRSIPTGASPVSVRLSFRSDAAGEQAVEFKDSAWSGPTPAGFNLKVFDDGFIHRNLFTGRGVNRDNKMALTTYILGDEGVALADKIGGLKKQRQQDQKRLQELSSDAFTGIADIPGFVGLAVTDLASSLEEKAAVVNEQLAECRTRLRNAAAIASRSLPDPVELKWHPQGLLSRLNKILERTIETIHVEAREQLRVHLRDHVRHESAGEAWVKGGLPLLVDQACPFCGQDLSPKAQALLDVYRTVFDSAYKKREAQIELDLATVVGDLQVNRVNVLVGVSSANQVSLGAFADLRMENDRESEFSAVDVRERALVDAAMLFQQALDGAAVDAQRLRDEKLQKPHEVVSPYENSRLLEAHEALQSAIHIYNDALETVSLAAAAFKDRNRTAPLEMEIRKLEAELQELGLRSRRLSLGAQCDEYASLAQSIADDQVRIAGLQSQLTQQQTDFLGAYFERLNHCFRTFGSEDFRLVLKTDSRGHKPVISLGVEFSDEEIQESAFERVFSESDRRALALAVYWAQVSGMPSSDKSKTILVLDDHVTSFDEHRVGTVHRTIASAAPQFRQVIFLGHFRSAFARLLATYERSLSPTLLRLERAGGSLTLGRWDKTELLEDEHARTAAALFDFADEAGPSPGASKLRVFLEQELAIRFREQLRREAVQENMLAARIDRMKERNIITESVQHQLHVWRETLNPEHHTWVDATIEDQRQTARQFMRFVYHDLQPA